MKKLIEISACNECSHVYWKNTDAKKFFSSDVFCGKSKKLLDPVLIEDTIPGWCELPDAKD